MLMLGGHFILVTPANNWFGHGFYQFGPDLFYQVFNSDNGFCVKEMVVTELNSKEYKEICLNNLNKYNLDNLKYINPELLNEEDYKYICLRYINKAKYNIEHVNPKSFNKEEYKKICLESSKHKFLNNQDY